MVRDRYYIWLATIKNALILFLHTCQDPWSDMFVSYFQILVHRKLGESGGLQMRQGLPALQSWDLAVISLVVQFSHSVMSDSATPWTAARQASLSITNSWSLLKLMSIELVMPSNHLILCGPLLLLLLSFPASWSFPMSQFFASGGHSIGASSSVLPVNIRD